MMNASSTALSGSRPLDKLIRSGADFSADLGDFGKSVTTNRNDKSRKYQIEDYLMRRILIAWKRVVRDTRYWHLTAKAAEVPDFIIKTDSRDPFGVEVVQATFAKAEENNTNRSRAFAELEETRGPRYVAGLLWDESFVGTVDEWKSEEALKSSLGAMGGTVGLWAEEQAGRLLAEALHKKINHYNDKPDLLARFQGRCDLLIGLAEVGAVVGKRVYKEENQEKEEEIIKLSFPSQANHEKILNFFLENACIKDRSSIAPLRFVHIIIRDHVYLDVFGTAQHVDAQNDYNIDAVHWAGNQLRLHLGSLADEMDLEGLLQLVAGVASHERRSRNSCLRVLFMHLLKWQFQPARRSPSWRATIANCRGELEDLFAESPSLAVVAGDTVKAEVIDTIYDRARRQASAETGLPLTRFPETCPYTIAEVLNMAWLPGASRPDSHG